MEIFLVLITIICGVGFFILTRSQKKKEKTLRDRTRLMLRATGSNESRSNFAGPSR